MADKNSIWKWMLCLLAVLNIVLLVIVWHRPSHQGPPMGEGGPAKMIIRELGLSEAQIHEFEKLKEQHHTAMVELQKKGRELRDGFFELLKQEHPDQQLVHEKALAIGKNQQEIELVTFTHFEQVRKLCDEKQKKKFDEMIQDILRSMAGPHRERPERSER